MTDDARHSPVTAWVWGGGFLIASALLPLVAVASLNAPGSLAAVSWIGMLTFTAALLVFAFGWRGRGSVVARRTLGTVALPVWALLGPAAALTAALLPPYDDGSASLYSALYYVEILAWIVAGTLSVVEIARADVVVRPWNRAPAWALGIVVGAGVLTQIGMVAVAGRPDGEEMLGLLSGLSSLVATLVPMLLGILAIVLALRTEPRPTVQVYPTGS
jgi:hypothetical protein